MYVIQHCFICRPSDYTVSVNAGIEPRTVGTLALTTRRSNHSAKIHPRQLNIKCQNNDQNNDQKAKQWTADYLNCKASYQCQLVACLLTWFCFYFKMWIWLPAWWLDWPGWQHGSHSVRVPVHKSYIQYIYIADKIFVDCFQSVVINDLYAKTGTWVGTENVHSSCHLNPLHLP